MLLNFIHAFMPHAISLLCGEILLFSCFFYNHFRHITTGLLLSLIGPKCVGVPKRLKNFGSRLISLLDSFFFYLKEQATAAYNRIRVQARTHARYRLKTEHQEQQQNAEGTPDHHDAKPPQNLDKEEPPTLLTTAESTHRKQWDHER